MLPSRTELKIPLEPPLSASHAADAPARLGDYTLVREIARSNDIVWEARDRDNRRVAVKELFLPATLTPEARRERVAAFHREAEAISLMDHPHIVSVYEGGEENGRFFIAMPFLEGQTLRGLMASGVRVTTERALRIASELCAAVAHVHARGVVHADIKPTNVMVGPDGRVTLIDFGIAVLADVPGAASGDVLGTPSYMSPEQIQGRPLDNRSDLFSLGVVIYEMLAGRRPFTGDSVTAVMERVVHHDMPSLPGLPLTVETVLRRALAKEPRGRFATADELQTALQAALAGIAGRHRFAAVSHTFHEQGPPAEPVRRARPMVLGLLALIALVALVAASAWITGLLRPHAPQSAPAPAPLRTTVKQAAVPSNPR